MALSMAELKAAFSTPANNNENNNNYRPNNYYPFWLMNTDEKAVIRFLPDLDDTNPLGFLVEKLTHTLTINGEQKKVPCLKNYNEDCPICKVSAAYYNDGDKINGKKYWRNKQHLAQVLVMEDPLPADKDSGETHEGKVRFITVGYQLYSVIKEAFESGDLDNRPYDYEGGYDFTIKKTQSGDYDSYALGSKFARHATTLSDEEISQAEDQMVKLNTLLPVHPGTERVEAMLTAALTGDEYVEAKTSNTSPTQAAKPAKAETPKTETPKDEVVTESQTESESAGSADEEYSDHAADILAKIQARRSNAE